LKLECLRDTYTQESVEALRIVRNSLIEELSQVNSDNAKAQEQLKAYKSAGEVCLLIFQITNIFHFSFLFLWKEFESIAKEYAELQSLAKNKRWALRKLEEAISKSQNEKKLGIEEEEKEKEKEKEEQEEKEKDQNEEMDDEQLEEELSFDEEEKGYF